MPAASVRILAVCALALLVCSEAPARDDSAQPRRSDAGAPAFSLRRTPVVEAVETVGPAVVNITTESVVERRPFQGLFRDPNFERFFRDFLEPRVPRPQRRARSLGSGVVIDDQRHVLTNEHVVARANRIRITLGDGREMEAVLVGADPNNDLAVLRIETEEDVPWVEPGASDDLLVGEPVIAIGNPFGLSNTVTTGVISALDRSLRTEERVYHGFMQTDASINPGNSGGPLLNAEGALIGINTAIYGGGAQGIGFAIPIEVAMRVVRELITHGGIAPVWLGLDLQALDPRLAAAFELPDDLRGALVARVHEGTPAARAGVERGEVLIQVDGHPIRNAREYYETLERSTPGQELRLELWRDGSSRVVTLGSEEIPPTVVVALAGQLLGLALEPGPRGGFVVSRVLADSGAARIGLETGDLLLGINGHGLKDEQALRRALLDLRGHARALVVVQRGRGRYHVTIPLG